MKATQKTPAGDTAMLIRKPVAEVFEAFINPDITTKFWFTKSTGKLEKGKSITWTWEMYNVTSNVLVKDIVQNDKIEIEWGSPGDDRTRVEWTFKPFDAHSTFVTIVTDGFTGDEEAILKKVSGSVGGFCWVLAGLKAYLEYNIQLNLVADRFPKGKH
jgi:uncharacterized protein YndB with AHSA1/START domain